VTQLRGVADGVDEVDATVADTDRDDGDDSIVAAHDHARVTVDVYDAERQVPWPEGMDEYSSNAVGTGDWVEGAPGTLPPESKSPTTLGSSTSSNGSIIPAAQASAKRRATLSRPHDDPFLPSVATNCRPMAIGNHIRFSPACSRRRVTSSTRALVGSALGLWGAEIYGQTENSPRNNP